jgi:aminoglycoside phosphotransferase (APT) family kinase protein
LSQLHRTPPPCYPWEWGIYPWLEGENPSIDGVTDDDSLTGDLERFVDALRRVDLPGGPPSRRGAPLAVQDEEARSALAELVSMIDTDAATAAWDEALKLPGWSGPPVWVHGDLLPGNLLLQAGRLTGVIDSTG